MKNKLLVFIYNKLTHKFLLFFDSKLQGDATNNQGFTLGKILSDKYNDQEVIDAVKSKTFLTPQEILSLNWGSIFFLNAEEIREMYYFAFVDSDKILLKDSDLIYEWLDLDTFITRIFWKDNKKLLRKVLIKAINKDIYFDKKEREESNRDLY